MPASIFLKAVGPALRIADVVAPAWTGKAAFDLFCSPPRGTVQNATEAKFAEKLAPLIFEADAHRIDTPDATVQAYLWRTTTSQTRGRVLLIHGWTGQSLVMGLFVKPLRDAGFDCVAIDLPAHGLSTGKRLSMPIGARAVLAAADSLGPFTGIIAHSFGGAVAALAVEGGSPMTRKLTIDKLVLISSPDSILQVTRNFGGTFGFNDTLKQRLADEVSRAAGRDIRTINIGTLLATAAKPCLIIHDEADEDVVFSEAEAIVAAAGAHATFMPTKGLGHRRIVVMPNVVRAAVRFLAA